MKICHVPLLHSILRVAIFHNNLNPHRHVSNTSSPWKPTRKHTTLRAKCSMTASFLASSSEIVHHPQETPQFLSPWKSWRKQTLNEPIKKQLWRLETSRREKLLSSGFVGWRWCSREAKDFQFAALQWANKTWKKPDHSSSTWWTMKSRSSSKNILLEEKKVRISSYCSFNHSENIWDSTISWYDDYSGSSLYLWYGQHHEDMTIDFVAAANWWTLPPFQTCRH